MVADYSANGGACQSKAGLNRAILQCGKAKRMLPLLSQAV
jgi:hypothetical protein